MTDQLEKKTQVYFILYSHPNGVGNAEAWLDYKDCINGIQDIRELERVICLQLNLESVTVENYIPLRLTKRGDESKIFFGSGETIPKQ